MVGALLSKKPAEVLELGVGTGDLTASIIYALSYNRKGRLTSVDKLGSTGAARSRRTCRRCARRG
jgi:tRNA A58 N-methylase Trm61